MRQIIINADGYGFTGGLNRAIEECIEFGTVRSISVNVNFKFADDLPGLLACHPELSVGCHLNPIVGSPVLPAKSVPSLVNGLGEFFYLDFQSRFLAGRISLEELKAEMHAQIDKIRRLAGQAFTHIDFHMGLHRLPRLYPAFLEVVLRSGVGRMRTHRSLLGMESRFPYVRHGLYLIANPSRIGKAIYNSWLRQRAKRLGLSMPQRRIEITHMGSRPEQLSLKNYLQLVHNLPEGISEFVVHPGYVDEDLRRWSTYLDSRELERKLLLNRTFRNALSAADISLVGYAALPVAGNSTTN